MTLPEREVLTELVAEGISGAMYIMQGDYFSELEATIIYAENQLYLQKLAHRTATKKALDLTPGEGMMYE